VNGGAARQIVSAQFAASVGSFFVAVSVAGLGVWAAATAIEKDRRCRRDPNISGAVVNWSFWSFRYGPTSASGQFRPSATAGTLVRP
jgi:hypothetical protein